MDKLSISVATDTQGQMGIITLTNPDCNNLDMLIGSFKAILYWLGYTEKDVDSVFNDVDIDTAMERLGRYIREDTNPRKAYNVIMNNLWSAKEINCGSENNNS